MTEQTFDQYLTENSERLQPAPVAQAEISRIFKEKLGVAPPKTQFKVGQNLIKLKPGKGPHDMLVTEYIVDVNVSGHKDDTRGAYWGVDYSLKWSYRNGSNGKSVGTAFILLDGKLLQWRDGY